MRMEKRLVRAGMLLGLCCVFVLGAAPGARGASGEKIVGGTQAAPGEFPGIVAFVSGDSGNDWQDQYCGGALIRPNWVLSAAHCFADENGQLIESKKNSLVVIGRNDLNSSDGERIPIKNIVLHEGYVRATYDNDIALVELQYASQSPRMKIPAFAVNFPVAPPGIVATAAGWGYTGQRPPDNSGTPDPSLFPSLLQKVELPVVSNETCAASGPTANMICAGFAEGGKDSCQGDSGGPLMVTAPGGGWLQVGVVSSGPGCASPGYYGLYTKLENYAFWISSHTCSPGEFPVGPVLSLSLDGSVFTAGADGADGAQGYILYLISWPTPPFVVYLDMGQQKTLQVDLAGAGPLAFWIGWQAYNESCLSPFSNFQFFQW